MLRAWAHEGIKQADIQLARVQRLLHAAALRLYSPELIERLGQDYFGRAEKFAEPEVVNSGLRQFERAAVERFFPKPPVRVFVPGCGGGREVLGLYQLGYLVDAVEPAHRLATTAGATLSRLEGVRVRNLSVQAWAHDNADEFAAILTGWGLWTSLLSRQDRLQVLKAFARACPDGPVLISFWRSEPNPEGPSPSSLLSRWLSQIAASSTEPGTDWWRGLYVHRVSQEELERESAEAGYVLAHYETAADELPHAVLLPKNSKPALQNND